MTGTRTLIFCGLALAGGWAAGRLADAGAPHATAPETPGRDDLPLPPARPVSKEEKAAGLTEIGIAAALADPRAAGERLRGTDHPDALRQLARRLALEPPPAMMQFLEAAAETDTLRDALLEETAVWASSRDPDKGLRLLASLAERPDIATLTRKAFHFFPPKDLPVVKSWYERLPDGALKNALLQELVPVLQRADAREAIRLVSGLPPGTKSNYINQLLLQTRFDPASESDRMAVLAQYPEEDRALVGSKLAGRQFGNLANFDKATALEMLSRGEASDPQNSPAYLASDLFSRWAESDPQRASSSLNQLPEEIKSPDLYRQTARQWTKGNVGQASQWVNQMAAGPFKQAAVTGLVEGLRTDYPAEAVTWAGTLTDPQARLDSLKAILSGTSAAQPPPGLSEALNSLNLTPEEKTSVTLSAGP